MTENERFAHAKRFDCDVQYVKYWHELSQTNQNRCYRMYDQSISLLQTKYIYLLGIDGLLISRRKLDYDYPPYSPHADRRF